jgi:hypothetical protein
VKLLNIAKRKMFHHVSYLSNFLRKYFISTVNSIDPTPPTVTNCPEPFVVHLNPFEESRSIQWKEPSFESKQPIKQVFKSKVPGHSFGAGVHVITYLATTEEGLSAKCTFRITVKGMIVHTLLRLQYKLPSRA